MSFRSTIFFFNDTATTEIYTLSLHDALPISATVEIPFTTLNFTKSMNVVWGLNFKRFIRRKNEEDLKFRDRKSTRLNSSHQIISYAVFCLKKKTKVVWIGDVEAVTSLVHALS